MTCFNYFKLFIALIIMWAPVATAVSRDLTSDQEREVQGLIQAFQQHYNQQDVNGILDLLHSRIEEPTPDAMKEYLKYAFSAEQAKQITCEILSTHTSDHGIAVHLKITDPSATKDDQPFHGDQLFILTPDNNKLRINGIYEQVDPEHFDKQTGVYSSEKGHLSLTLPAGWMALAGPTMLRGITIDSLTALAPDLQSKLIMGVLQMPLNLADSEKGAAQKAIEADTAMEKRECLEHRIIEEGPTTILGKEAYRMTTEFKSKEARDSNYKRLRIYLSDPPMLYFFVCDAMSPDAFDTLSPQFEGIVQSMEMLPIEEGISRQEAMAAQGAQGSVSGRVYTSEEFNCFIAAPEGWEIQTNPDPSTQVQMQYTAGKSIARLLAVKDLDKAGKSITLNYLFTQRLNQVKQIVQNFSETSRRDVTIAGVPGIESIQTFSLEALGRFHVKEVTLLNKGTYYLILCQCIEPDDFTVLEKDFDNIIESFGFIQ